MERRVVAVLALVLAMLVAAPAAARAAGSISGRVTDSAGAPVGGVAVMAGGSTFGTTWTETRADGYYEIALITPGSWQLRFDPQGTGGLAPEWYDDAGSEEDATPVVVREGEATRGIDARLSPGGTLRGQVTHTAGDGRDASVEVLCIGGDPADDRLVPTDAEGRWAAAGLPPGAYRVRASPMQYVGDPEPDEFAAWAPGVRSEDEARTFDVHPRTSTDVDLVLPRVAHLTGRVLTTDGAPIHGASVYAHPPGDAVGPTVFTDAEGRYDVGHLWGGPTTVEVRADGFPSDEREVTAVAEATTSLADFHLQPPSEPPFQATSTVSGRVTDPEGHGLGGVTVLSYGEPRFGAYEVTTDADGRWSVAVEGGGQAHFRFTPPWHSGLLTTEWGTSLADRNGDHSVHVVEGEPLTGLDQVLPRAATLSGRVTGPPGGAPGSSLEVLLEPVDTWGMPNPRVEQITASSADGSWTADDLEPGLYRVHAREGRSWGDDRPRDLQDQNWSDGTTADGADVVDARSGTSRGGLDVRLRREGSVAGRVTGPDGAPVAGARVAAWVPRAPAAVARATSDAAGRYEVALDALGPGDVVVQVDGPEGAGLSRRFAPDAGSVAAAARLSVPAGNRRDDTDVRLPAGAPIVGTVVADEGPAPTATDVVVYDDAGGEVGRVSGGSTFTTPTLPAGRYRLRIAAAGAWTEYYADADTLEAATPVVVAPDGPPVAITASLEPRVPTGTPPPAPPSDQLPFDFPLVTDPAPAPDPGPATTASATTPPPAATTPAAASAGAAAPSARGADGAARTPARPSGMDGTPALALPAGALPVGGDAVAVPLRCGQDAACAGTLRLLPRTGRATTLGTGRFDLRPGVRRAVRVALTARGRTALRRSGRLSARLVLRPAGGRATRRAVVLRRR